MYICPCIHTHIYLKNCVYVYLNASTRTHTQFRFHSRTDKGVEEAAPYCCVLHCNTLQHTATHCNTLQHTATHCNSCVGGLPSSAPNCCVYLI